MKKRKGIKRALAPISVAQLEDMPTAALLARLTRLRWCEESRAASDLTADEIASVEGQILFKDNPAWHTAWKDLKTILSRREHVEKATD